MASDATAATEGSPTCVQSFNKWRWAEAEGDAKGWLDVNSVAGSKAAESRALDSPTTGAWQPPLECVKEEAPAAGPSCAEGGENHEVELKDVREMFEGTSRRGIKKLLTRVNINKKLKKFVSSRKVDKDVAVPDEVWKMVEIDRDQCSTSNESNEDDVAVASVDTDQEKSSNDGMPDVTAEEDGSSADGLGVNVDDVLEAVISVTEAGVEGEADILDTLSRSIDDSSGQPPCESSEKERVVVMPEEDSSSDDGLDADIGGGLEAENPIASTDDGFEVDSFSAVDLLQRSERDFLASEVPGSGEENEEVAVEGVELSLADVYQHSTSSETQPDFRETSSLGEAKEEMSDDRTRTDLTLENKQPDDVDTNDDGKADVAEEEQGFVVTLQDIHLSDKSIEEDESPDEKSCDASAPEEEAHSDEHNSIAQSSKKDGSSGLDVSVFGSRDDVSKASTVKEKANEKIEPQPQPAPTPPYNLSAKSCKSESKPGQIARRRKMDRLLKQMSSKKPLHQRLQSFRELRSRKGGNAKTTSPCSEEVLVSRQCDISELSCALPSVVTEDASTGSFLDLYVMRSWESGSKGGIDEVPETTAVPELAESQPPSSEGEEHSLAQEGPDANDDVSVRTESVAALPLPAAAALTAAPTLDATNTYDVLQDEAPAMPADASTARDCDGTQTPASLYSDWGSVAPTPQFSSPLDSDFHPDRPPEQAGAQSLMDFLACSGCEEERNRLMHCTQDHEERIAHYCAPYLDEEYTVGDTSADEHTMATLETLSVIGDVEK
ncbi:hypothetical protein ACHAXT_008116 [Thalassiosira profunda]